MAGVDDGVIGQNHQLLVDARDQAFVAAAGEVGASDTRVEQSVTAEDRPVSQKAHSTGAVPRGMQDFEVQVVDVYGVTVLQ